MSEAPTNGGEDLVGRVLAGTYRLTSVLGRGAMGVVYKARNDVLEQDVAVKVLAPELAEDEHVRSRLLQEARALTLLSHRNIVPVRHCGEEDGLLFVVMGLCPGETLGALLRREGALPEARAAAIAQQILEALAEAHASGIVHRDLKPDNVMIEQREDEGGAPEDFVSVLDFGLARAVGAARTNMPGAMLTMDGDVVGTVAYMSPEQVRAASDVDARSDLFSMGVVLYEMLAGRLPFESDSALSVMMRILEAPPPPLPESAPKGISRAMHAVVMRALMKDREDRFQSAADFLAALAGELDPREASARRQTTSRPRPAARPLRTWATVGLGAIAVGALLLVLLGGGEPDPRAQARDAAATCAHGTVIRHLGALARHAELDGEERLALAKARIETGDAEAARDLDEAERLLGAGDPRVHVLRGRLHAEIAGEPKRALDAFATAIVNDQASIEGLYPRARMLLTPAFEAYARAEGLDRTALLAADVAAMERRAPHDWRVPLISGRLQLLRVQDLEAAAERKASTQTAIQLLRTAEEREPRAAEPPLRIANAYNLLSQDAKQAEAHEDMHAARERAVAAYDRAVERVEAMPAFACQVSLRTSIYRGRSYARLALGDTEGAVADTRAVYADGKDLPEYVEMAEGLRSSGHIDEAIELYERLVEATQDSGAWFNLGYCFERRAYGAMVEDDHARAASDYGRAIEAFTRALATSKSPLLVRAYRGEASFRRALVSPSNREADLDAAREDFETAAAGWSNLSGRIELDYRYVPYLCHLGQVDRARERLTETIEAGSGLNPSAHGLQTQVLVCSAARAAEEGGEADVVSALLDRAVKHLADAEGLLGGPTRGTRYLRAHIEVVRGMLSDRQDLRKAIDLLQAASVVQENEEEPPHRRTLLLLLEALELNREPGSPRSTHAHAMREAHLAAIRAGRFGPDRATYAALAKALEAKGPAWSRQAALAREARDAALR